ncbi:hypothetical protein ACT3CD_08290 [Geofilum sp. OHC36d9]|uniref:hypothetical protein n=1 Tax=Geofilum sp. OHC36d9 TaxID=3458413 RepID=UPI0040340F6C
MMRSIAEYKNIKTKDIIVFTRRGYSFEWENIKPIPLYAPIFTNSVKNKPLFCFVKKIVFIMRISLWTINILKILKFKRCELYIPNSGIIEWNLLTSKILPKSFNYIEEGNQYYKKDWLLAKEKKVRIKERLPYLGILKYTGHFSNRVKNTFIYSNEIRNDIPGSIILLDLKHTLKQIEIKDQKKEVILVIDGGSTWNQAFSLNQHASTLKDVLGNIKLSHPNLPLSFKLHPNQYASIKETSTFRTLIREYFPNAKELPPETVPASYLGNKNKIIYAGDSSLSLYSYILGIPIKSHLFSYSKNNKNYTIENRRKRYPINYILCNCLNFFI